MNGKSTFSAPATGRQQAWALPHLTHTHEAEGRIDCQGEVPPHLASHAIRECPEISLPIEQKNKMARGDTWYSRVKNRLCADGLGSVSWPPHSALGLHPELLSCRLRLNWGLKKKERKKKKVRHFFCTTYRCRNRISKPHFHKHFMWPGTWEQGESNVLTHVKSTQRPVLGIQRVLWYVKHKWSSWEDTEVHLFKGRIFLLFWMSPHTPYYAEDHQNITSRRKNPWEKLHAFPTVVCCASIKALWEKEGIKRRGVLKATCFLAKC